MNTNKCPFQVGDRIRHAPTKSYYYDAASDQHIEINMATWYPDATVTKITEEGFEFKYDEPYSLGARFGTTDGGTCFPEGFPHWMLLRAADGIYWEDSYISI